MPYFWISFTSLTICWMTGVWCFLPGTAFSNGKPTVTWIVGATHPRLQVKPDLDTSNEIVPSSVFWELTSPCNIYKDITLLAL